MVITFGYNKVAIESGLNGDGVPTMRLTKLFKANDYSLANRYDFVQLDFKTIESIDTLMSALKYLKELNENDESRH